MTQSGEQLTLKGEIQKELENVYLFQKSWSISHSINIDDRRQVEVSLFPGHQHAALLFQMVFVLKGKAVFRKKGSDEIYASIGSRQHNLLVINPTCVHMLMSSAQDEVICINLSSPFMRRYLPTHHAWQQLTNSPMEKMLLTLINGNMMVTPEISTVLQRLNQTTNSNFHDQLILESKAIELLALQLLQVEQLQNVSPLHALKKEDMDKMQAAREILINHTGKPLSLRSLAHLVGTNEFNLKRNFKNAFGQTVYNYLNQHKMGQARIMLQKEDITIAEIAERMGYKYATHFSSAFKKHFGCLPNSVRSGKLTIILFLEEILMTLENAQTLMLR